MGNPDQRHIEPAVEHLQQISFAKTVNDYFCERVPSQMFGRILNTTLPKNFRKSSPPQSQQKGILDSPCPLILLINDKKMKSWTHALIFLSNTRNKNKNLNKTRNKKKQFQSALNKTSCPTTPPATHHPSPANKAPQKAKTSNKSLLPLIPSVLNKFQSSQYQK